MLAAVSLGASAGHKSVKEVRHRTGAAVVTAGGAPLCATGSPCHMLYYGGKVIPNAKVFVVNWTSTVAPGGDLGAFYNAVTDSTYLDWLNEYDTNITPTGTGGAATGTNQLIGRGAYGGTFTITPSTANAGGTCPATTPAGTTVCLTDAQVQNELNAQIAAGPLPPSDENALYMTYFPPHTFIAGAGSGSCISGGFCGYHSTHKDSTREFYYGVLPDHGPGSGCDTGCGSSTTFNNLTSTSAHELCEAITDAEVGIVPATSNLGLGWYDNQNGEVGDMCSSTSVVAGYTVQNIFSNLVAAASPTASCVSSRTATDDFSVSLAANRKKVAGGTSITVPITTAVTAGSPGTLTLSFSGLPAHVSGSLDHATVSAGSGAVLTLTADASPPSAANVVVQVEAVAGSTIHTAGLLLDVAPGTTASDFSLSITPPANTTLAPGSSGVYTVTTAAIGSFTTSLALAVGTLPTGVTGAFSPASVTPGQSSMLTLAAASSAATAPSTTFTVTGTAGALSHGTTSIVGVGSPNVFSLSLAPATSAVAANGTTTFTVHSAVVTGDATETISLTVAGLPGGVIGTFTPSMIHAGDSATLSLAADATVTAGGPTLFEVDGASLSDFEFATAGLTVSGADFTLALSPSTGSVAAGGHLAYTVTATVASGAPANVALTLTSALPTGLSAGFSASTIAALPGTSTLTLTAATTAPPASAMTFTVQGIDDTGVAHTATAQVSVIPATNDFTLSLAPAAATVALGNSVQVQVATAVVSGVAESIALVASGLPAGVTAAFNPATVTAGGSATLTFAAAASAVPVSAASCTVTGTAASAAHGASLALTVAPPPTVSITHPDAAATVSGAVEIDATAAAGPGATLLKVELLVDGVVAATLPGSPAQGFWQSTESAEGAHTLTARAVDSNGGSTLSAPVEVTAHNAPSTTTAAGGGGGGCASGGASLSALLGLLVTLRRRRVT